MSLGQSGERLVRIEVEAARAGDQLGERPRGADVVAETAARVVTISAQALQHASDACRMHFYQGFLDVIAGRLADANARLASL